MPQRTLSRSVSTVGVGLHSGADVSLTIHPSPPDSGICFVRSDLQDAPAIFIDAMQVTDTMMSSNLEKDGVRVGTVEHLLAALAGLGIDNARIEVSAPEVPILDGSANHYVELLVKAGIEKQNASKTFIKVLEPIKVKAGEKWAMLTPVNSGYGFSVQFEIDFNHPVIAQAPQQFSFNFSTNNFLQQIATARTFGFLQDIDQLKKQGLVQGGSLDNAIVLDDTTMLNQEALRFKEEFVRHKILDAMGDLYISGKQIIGHFSAYKSGHELNNRLIRKLLSDALSYEYVTEYVVKGVEIDYEQ